MDKKRLRKIWSTNKPSKTFKRKEYYGYLELSKNFMKRLNIFAKVEVNYDYTLQFSLRERYLVKLGVNVKTFLGQESQVWYCNTAIKGLRQSKGLSQLSLDQIKAKLVI